MGPDARCALRCVALSAREEIPTRWQREHAVGLVRRGVIIRQRSDAQGRASAVDAAGSGSLVPLTVALPPTPTVTEMHLVTNDDAHEPLGYAATDARVCLLPASALGAALGRNGAARSFLWLSSHMLDRVERTAQARSRGTAESRVAALICALADTLSPNRVRDTLPAGLLQRDLAALGALRTESVCRSLQSLAQKRAISRQPDGIKILDRPALEAL